MMLKCTMLRCSKLLTFWVSFTLSLRKYWSPPYHSHMHKAKEANLVKKLLGKLVSTHLMPTEVMHPHKMTWIMLSQIRTFSFLCSWLKERNKRGTDIICFKTINKFNAQENKIENKEVNNYNNVLKMVLIC